MSKPLVATATGTPVVDRTAALSPLVVTVGGYAGTAKPKEFSTGSIGWYASFKAEVDGKPCQVACNIVVIGSKPG